MRVIDFFKRGQVNAPPAPAAHAPAPTAVSPEALIEDDGWGFRPSSETPTARYYTHDQIEEAALIYAARSLARIANDVEVIRKHLTKLHVVSRPQPGDDPAA